MHHTSPQSIAQQARVQAAVGTVALVVGAVLVGLGFLAEITGRLPFFMPRSWYVNRPLWYFLVVICFGVGGYLLKSRRLGRNLWQATRPGIRFRQVVLYTREDCHLCDEAKATLDQYGSYLPAVHEVDIDTDRQLIQRFGTCVPVVQIDGKIRFRGRVDEILLRRLIEGTDPLTT